MPELDGAAAAEVEKQKLEAAWAVKAEFDSETLALWTGGFDLTYDGDTYTNVGELLAVEEAGESAEITAPVMRLTLSGIPTRLFDVAADEPYQGRTVTLFLVLLSGTSTVTDPQVVFRGRADQMEITETGETTTVALTVESRLADLDRSRERRYTHHDQQIDFPGDLGLEYVTFALRFDYGFGVSGGDSPIDPGPGDVGPRA